MQWTPGRLDVPRTLAGPIGAGPSSATRNTVAPRVLLRNLRTDTNRLSRNGEPGGSIVSVGRSRPTRLELRAGGTGWQSADVARFSARADTRIAARSAPRRTRRQRTKTICTGAWKVHVLPRPTEGSGRHARTMASRNPMDERLTVRCRKAGEATRERTQSMPTFSDNAGRLKESKWAMRDSKQST